MARRLFFAAAVVSSPSDDRLDAAAVRVVEHLSKVLDGPIAWNPCGVDGEVVMDAQPDDGLREAVRATVIGEVDGRVAGELLDDVAVLGHPPVVVLEHDEHHLLVVLPRGDVERDDAVVCWYKLVVSEISFSILFFLSFCFSRNANLLSNLFLASIPCLFRVWFLLETESDLASSVGILSESCSVSETYSNYKTIYEN